MTKNKNKNKNNNNNNISSNYLDFKIIQKKTGRVMNYKTRI